MIILFEPTLDANTFDDLTIDNNILVSIFKINKHNQSTLFLFISNMSQESSSESFAAQSMFLNCIISVPLPTDYNPEKYFTFDNLKFVLLAGKQRAGKTSAANHIVKQLNTGYESIYAEKYALAATLKDIVNDLTKLFGVEIGSMHDEDTKVKYRKYLQTVGTEIFRNKVFEDIWSQLLLRDVAHNIAISKNDYMKHKLEKYHVEDSATHDILKDMSGDSIRVVSSDEAVTDGMLTNVLTNKLKTYVVVIDDIRFQNEINFFRNRFGDKVTVIQIDRTEVVDVENADHCSEHQTLVVDNIVHNIDTDMNVYLNDVYELVKVFVEKDD